MSADEQFGEALRRLVAALHAGPNPFYAPQLEAAGLSADGDWGVADFVSRCPFTTKADLARDHAVHPPFGSNLTRPISDYSHLCRTSGTTGEPISWPDTPSSWAAMLDAWEAIYRSAGIQPGRDRLYFAFSFGPFLGFWTAFEAAARMGCMAIPGGGLSSSARMSAITELGATVICCTPTYALRLGENEGARESVRMLIVAGEPGGSVPAVREQISALWGGAKVVDHHGMTEVGPVSLEPPGETGNLCLIPGAHFGEVVDPESGREVGEGERGELVLTTLRRDDCPVLRYRTGDLVQKRTFDLDGVPTLGFEGGILGRIDDMVVVRGVNIYPSAVDAVLRRFDEVEEYQVAVTDERSMAELTVRLELRAGTDDAIADRIRGALGDVFSLRLPVEVVPEGSLPRFEFKAKRWLRE